jgi:transposase
MKANNRKRFDASLKARVALAALEEGESMAQLGQRFGVHPVQVGQWKRQLLKNASAVFTREGARDSEYIPECTSAEVSTRRGEPDLLVDLLLAEGLAAAHAPVVEELIPRR